MPVTHGGEQTTPPKPKMENVMPSHYNSNTIERDIFAFEATVPGHGTDQPGQHSGEPGQPGQHSGQHSGEHSGQHSVDEEKQGFPP